MTRRVAILGAGIGASHLAGYMRLPDRFEVAAICDLDEARGRALAAKAPGAVWTPSLDETLADASLDVIDVCLPPHLHHAVCARALDAGRAVICEKPLVSSLAEADDLIARAKAGGGRLLPIFQYRFGLGAAQLHALVDAGLAGRPIAGTLETHWDRDAAYYAVPWRGTWAGEQGGAILGHAIHIHDMLGVLVGPVERVYAELSTAVNEIEVEDCAAITFRLANGALITSSVTLGAAGNTSRLRLCFEGVTVESGADPYAPAEQAWRFIARKPVAQADVDAVVAATPAPLAGYAGLFEAAADALDGRGRREVTAEDGRASLELVTAIYASARAGAPVSLPIGSGHPLYRGWLP